MPLTTLAVAMLLSIRFNRSRYSFLLLFLGLAWAGQTQLRGQLLPATESLLFALLFVNAFAFSLLKDRSLFSVHGLLRGGILLLQAGVTWLLVTQAPAVPAALLQHEPVGAGPRRLTEELRRRLPNKTREHAEISAAPIGTYSDTLTVMITPQ